MLIINKPEVIERGDDAVLRASFHCGDLQDELWFSTPKENKPYLCHERGDAFVVGLLLYAMKRGEDITVSAPVSERLYYTLTTYYIPFIAKIFPGFKKIRILCETDAGRLDNAGAVGTGFSCGIDSFCTLIEHTRGDCPPGYRLSHLTFFNVGASGDYGGDHARELFRKRMVQVKPCADEFGLPLITLDSNINEILQMDFVQTTHYRNVAAVLALEKLFRVYYYSSGYPVEQCKVDYRDSATYDVFGLDMLSTDDVKFFSAGSAYTRVEKTEIVSSEPRSYTYLNVCVAEDTNCSRCPKCERTLVTLDVIGKLPLYDRVFSLDTYRKYRSRWLANLLLNEGKDKFKKEIHDAMHRYHYRIPLSAYAWMPVLWGYRAGYNAAAFLYITYLIPLISGLS